MATSHVCETDHMVVVSHTPREDAVRRDYEAWPLPLTTRRCSATVRTGLESERDWTGNLDSLTSSPELRTRHAQ